MRLDDLVRSFDTSSSWAVPGGRAQQPVTLGGRARSWMGAAIGDKRARLGDDTRRTHPHHRTSSSGVSARVCRGGIEAIGTTLHNGFFAADASAISARCRSSVNRLAPAPQQSPSASAEATPFRGAQGGIELRRHEAQPAIAFRATHSSRWASSRTGGAPAAGQDRMSAVAMTVSGDHHARRGRSKLGRQ